MTIRYFSAMLCCLCGLSLLLAAQPACAAGRGDWWMCQHDPLHTGRSPYSGPASPVLKWKYTMQDAIDKSSATLGADGTIYIGSHDHNLYAFAPDGTLKWKFATEGMIEASPTIAADGTIYLGSYDNCLYALHPDGSLKWKYTAGLYFNSSPVIGPDGTVYVGSVDNNFYAFNPADGKSSGNLPRHGISPVPRRSDRTARCTWGRTMGTCMRSMPGWLAEVEIRYGKLDHRPPRLSARMVRSSSGH